MSHRQLCRGRGYDSFKGEADAQTRVNYIQKIFSFLLLHPILFLSKFIIWTKKNDEFFLRIRHNKIFIIQFFPICMKSSCKRELTHRTGASLSSKETRLLKLYSKVLAFDRHFPTGGTTTEPHHVLFARIYRSCILNIARRNKQRKKIRSPFLRFPFR